MEVVVEPYVKWQEPVVEVDAEEEETAEPQLLERRPKHRIATSSESDSVESSVSEVTVNGDLKAENGEEGGETDDNLRPEEVAGVKKAEELVNGGELAEAELSGENVYFDKASGSLNGTSGVQFKSSEVSVVEVDGSIIQSSEVIEETVTIQESLSIVRTQHTAIKDTEFEPAYNSSESVLANESRHPTLDSTISGNGDISMRDHNGQEYYIKNYYSEELGVIYEGDPEPIDYDVEGVLKKQESHDLICPNCRACITRRVLLKKRKRVPKDTHPSAERDRIEETDDSERSPSATVQEALDEILPKGSEDTRTRKEVITCWSCFSLLIPSGKGFIKFRLFGDRKQPEPEVISETSLSQTPPLASGGGKSQDQKSKMKPATDKEELKIKIDDEPDTEFITSKESKPLKSEDMAVEGSKLPVRLATGIGKGSSVTAGGPEEVPRHIVIPIPIETQLVPQVVQVGEARDWDILKSIVYGGLIESITSLGVVASAAGAETATLNILVLGLANLIGGLILIFHNLKNLRKSAYEGPSNQVDRYYEVIGRRNNFKLHAVIVVLSFLIFGLIPVVTYGFSFRKSDNRDYKSLAVIGASLISITLLSLGKAHTKNPPRAASSYFKSLSYYLTIAVSASGLSYVAGKLLQELIEKTGWFDTTSSLNSITFPMPSQPSWGSY